MVNLCDLIEAGVIIDEVARQNIDSVVCEQDNLLLLLRAINAIGVSRDCPVSDFVIRFNDFGLAAKVNEKLFVSFGLIDGSVVTSTLASLNPGFSPEGVATRDRLIYDCPVGQRELMQSISLWGLSLIGEQISKLSLTFKL